MHRAFLFAAFALATGAQGQTDTAATPASPPPAAEGRPTPAELSPSAGVPPAPNPTPAPPQVPGEILIPQYPPGVTPPTAGPVQLDPAALTQWRQEKLSFAAGSSTVIRGPNAEPVGRVDFYKIVGRPDLAARQEDQQRRQIWFVAGGAAVVAASLIGGIALANSNDAPVTYSNPTSCYYPVLPGTASNGCDISAHTWQTTTGTVIAVVGGLSGLVLIGLGMAAGHPVTTVPEDQNLVGEYNDLLLQRLAAAKKSSVPPFSPTPRVDVQVGSGGGMLKAFWTF